MHGHRALPRRPAVRAREIVELLFVAQKKEPKLPVASVEADGEIGARALFVVEDHLLVAPRSAFVAAALEHDVVVADVARPVIAPLGENEHVAVRRLDDRGDAIVRLVVRRERESESRLEERLGGVDRAARDRCSRHDRDHLRDEQAEIE